MPHLPNEPNRPDDGPADPAASAPAAPEQPAAPELGGSEPGAPEPGEPDAAAPEDPQPRAPMHPGTAGNPFPPFAGGFGPWPDNQYFPQEDSAGQQLLDEQRATAADRADPKRWPMLGTSALAAVLAVVAPLLTFWQYRVGRGASTFRYSGWGAVTSSNGAPVIGHSERYGAALLVPAIVLATGTVLVLTARWRLGNLVIALGAAALIGLGLLSPVITEQVGSIHGQSVDAHTGPGLWLLGLAAVLAAIALVLAALRVLAAGRPVPLPRQVARQPGV